MDAFTSTPFSGNPAAVVPLSADALPLPDALRLQIAAEMNLAETAFLEPLERGAAEPYRSTSRFRLRWFTPTTEVPLCGHATLASAAVIYQGARWPPPWQIPLPAWWNEWKACVVHCNAAAAWPLRDWPLPRHAPSCSQHLAASTRRCTLRRSARARSLCGGRRGG